MAQKLCACLFGGREKLPVDFASRARLGKGDGNTASHDVWQIQRDRPLSEVAEESEGFGEGFGGAHSLGTALLVDLIVKFTIARP